MLLSILFVGFILILASYYTLIIVMLMFGNFNKRKTFLISLIPFGGLMIIIINAYIKLESTTKTIKETT